MSPGTVLQQPDCWPWGPPHLLNPRLIWIHKNVKRIKNNTNLS